MTTLTTLLLFNFPLVFFSIIAIILFVSSVYGNINKDDNIEVDEETSYLKEYLDNETKSFTFYLENTSNIELELDLCNLENSVLYKFDTPSTDYKKLVEYLKVNSFNVNLTRVSYNNASWKKDIIRSLQYTPFRIIENPIFHGYNNMSPFQFQSNLVDTAEPYKFNYFNSLKVKLNPSDKKIITLFVTDDDNSVIDNTKYLACLSITNNTNEDKMVKLFDRKFFSKIKDNEIEIESIYKKGEYPVVMDVYCSRPLIAKYIKFLTEYSFIKCKINKNVHNVIPNINAFQTNILELDMAEPLFIGEFEINVEANSELLVSFY